MSSIPPTWKNKFELCLNNDDLSDCVFVVGRQKCLIKGHKLLFGLSSPVFRSMLYEDSKNVATIQIEDVEADEFKGMKQFFYTDSVNFTSVLNACSVYLASWKYVIPELMKKCVQYIKDNITVGEVIDVYEFSRINNIPDIERICSTVFTEKTSEIMNSDKFLLADIGTLETILKLDSLNLKSELEVFKHTERWVLAEAARKNIDSQQLCEHFNCITRHIRFSTMDLNQYQEGPAESNLLTAEKKLLIAHKLMGVKSRSKMTSTAMADCRIFTEKEETAGEKEEPKEEDDDEGKKEEVKKQKQSIEIDRTQQIRIANNAEKLDFIFSKNNMSHTYRFRGRNFRVQLEGQSVENPFEFDTFAHINKHKIKLHSMERVKFVKLENDNTHYFENVPIEEYNNQYLFRYSPMICIEDPTFGEIICEVWLAV